MPIAVNGRAKLVGPDGRPLESEHDHGSGLEHVNTFAGLFNTMNKTYSWRWDEAYSRNREDALAMRRDCWLMSMLRERQRPVEQCPWHLEPDDQKDEEQQEAAEYFTGIIRGIDDLEQIFRDLGEALWYGRGGSQFKVDNDSVNGETVTTVVDHWPVNGDKIQFGWDGTPKVLVYAGAIPELEAAGGTIVGVDGDTRTTTLNGATIQYGERGRMLLLDSPYWRQRFAIEKADVIDADFFEYQMAGGVHGVGLRHWCYWIWWLARELESWGTDFIERTGLGLTLVYYQSGNDESKKRAKQFAMQESRNTVLLVPRDSEDKNAAPAVERIETNTAGTEIILRMIERLESKIERMFIGQTLSSGTEGSGLGGTGVASMHTQTKHEIIKGDAQKRGGTLTRDLVRPLMKWNRPDLKFKLRWVFDLADPQAKERLEAAKTFVDMGGAAKEDEVRGLAGLSKPEEDDIVLQASAEGDQDASDGFGGVAPSANGDGAAEPFSRRVDGAERYDKDSHRGQPENSGQFGPGGGMPPQKPVSRRRRYKADEHEGKAPPAPTPAPQQATQSSQPPEKKAKKKHGKSKAKVVVSEPVEGKAKGLLAELLGPKVGLEELASLVGAPDDATVTVRPGTDKLIVSVEHEKYTARRIIGDDPKQGLYINNDEFWMKPGAQGEGLGTEIFGRQVENAQELGFAYIKCHAAKDNPRNPEKPHNGYYTWPRFGYDQTIDDLQDNADRSDQPVVGKVRKEFPEAETILDVMETETGRGWWKANGCDLTEMKFDLSEGSRSLKVFDAYLEERELRRPAKQLAEKYARQQGENGGNGVEDCDLADWEEEALEASWKRRELRGESTQHGRADSAEHYAAGKESGHWVTMGGKPGADGKKHGGTPVYIENGRITKGHPSLVGKKIDALDEAAEPTTHRKEANQGKGYARAVHAKNAKAEGVHPQHLHQLAAEFLAHDKAHKEERTAMLQRERKLSERLGHGNLSNLKQRTAGGKVDVSHVKGLDDVAANLASEYPGFSGDAEELFDMLLEGNPEHMTEDEAYGQALEHLVEHRVSDPVGESTLRDGRSVTFIPHAKQRGDETTVMVDAAKLDRAWKADEGYHLPSGKSGATHGVTSEVGGRREEFEKFLDAGHAVQASRVSIDKQGVPSFEDGRHRFAVLRDAGVGEVAVTVPKSQAARVRQKFGAGAGTKRVEEAVPFERDITDDPAIHYSDLFESMHPRDDVGRFTEKLHGMTHGELSRVGGHTVRRTGAAEWRVETDKGHVTGDVATVAKHISARQSVDRLEGRRRIDAALARAATHAEPDFFTEPERGEAESLAFHSLPKGTRVISLAEETHGRTGEIVAELSTDAGGKRSKRNRVKLDGSPELLDIPVEPMDERLSWRGGVREEEKPRAKQGMMFERDDKPATFAPLLVYVADIYADDGSFTGHDVVMGYADAAAARMAYNSTGKAGLGALTPMTAEQFRGWFAGRDPKMPAWETNYEASQQPAPTTPAPTTTPPPPPGDNPP